MTTLDSVPHLGVSPEGPTAAMLAVERYQRVANAVWDEVIASVMRTHLLLDETGTGLVTSCRAGVLVEALGEVAPELRQVMASDLEREFVNAARTHVESLEGAPRAFFRVQESKALTYAPDVFGVAVCGEGLNSTASLLNGMASLERVVRTGGHVVIAALAGASFPLLHEVLTEVAWQESADMTHALEDLVHARVDEAGLRAAAERCHLEVVHLEEVTRRLVLGDASEAMTHPLVEREWLPALRPMLDGLGPWQEKLAARLAGWFGDALVEDQVSMFVAILRVSEDLAVPEVLAESVDELDVLTEEEDGGLRG